MAPSDAQITFADHMGRFYARRYAFPPMVGRLIGYLAVCDPPAQTISELAEALLASRSAITGAIATLEATHAVRRSRSAGDRMDRVRIDLSSPRALGMDITEYQEMSQLANEGLEVLHDAPAGRRAVLLEMSAFSDFLLEQIPRIEQEWKARRAVLVELANCLIRREEERAMSDTGKTVAIEAVGVRKSFDGTVALDGVDFSVATGTICALLGPNGAGKTTMIRILSTLIRPDSGEVWVSGHNALSDPDAVRAGIGVTGQFSAVDDLLTGAENMALIADLHHLERAIKHDRVSELLHRFDLSDAAGRPVATYSGGMRRRLGLAMTLVGTPSVIFLDEPTTGLDPSSRRTMWESIRALVASGVTILLTTQYLEEADQLADNIVVLDKGRVVAAGTSEELKRRTPGGHVLLEFATQDVMNAAAALIDGASVDAEKLVLQVPSDGTVASLRRMLVVLEDAGIDVDHLSIHTPDLDDVFFAVTGHAAQEAVAKP